MAFNFERGLGQAAESVSKTLGVMTVEEQRAELEDKKLRLANELASGREEKGRAFTTSEREASQAFDKPYKDVQADSVRTSTSLALRKANREEQAGDDVSSAFGGGRSGGTSSSYAERIGGLEGGTKKGGMINNELGSGAFGPYQFMEGTWADVRKNHADLNLPADMRQASKEQHKAAFDSFTADNAAALSKSGIEATPANLYLAHRFGAGGATKVLNSDGNARLADVLPLSWQEKNPDMRGQTVDGFKRLAEERMKGVTMDGGGQSSTDSMPAGLSAALKRLATIDPKGAVEQAQRWEENRRKEAAEVKAAAKTMIGENGIVHVVNPITKVAEPLLIDGQVMRVRDEEKGKAQTEMIRTLGSRLSEVSRSYMPEILAKEATVRALEKDMMLSTDKDKQRELAETKTQVKALRDTFNQERAPIIERLDAIGVQLGDKAGLKGSPTTEQKSTKGDINQDVLKWWEAVKSVAKSKLAPTPGGSVLNQTPIGTPTLFP